VVARDSRGWGPRQGTRLARVPERWWQHFRPTKNTSIRLQVDAQEWMGHQVECLVQAMDLQRDVQEVLAPLDPAATEQPHRGSAWAGGGVGWTQSNWGGRVWG